MINEKFINNRFFFFTGKVGYRWKSITELFILAIVIFAINQLTYCQITKDFVKADSTGFHIDKHIKTQDYPDGKVAFIIYQTESLILMKYQLLGTPLNKTYYLIEEITRIGEGEIKYKVTDPLGATIYIIWSKERGIRCSYDQQYFIVYSGEGLEVKFKGKPK